MSSKAASGTPGKSVGSENPVSRKKNLVVQEFNGEVLIYDLRVNKAFCLNETSALVWQACDGTNSVSEIGRKLGNDEIVWLALNELKKKRLIEDFGTSPSRFDGLSRREIIKKIGLGSMIALPMVSSLVAPTAAHAQSVCAPGMACTCDTTGTNGGTCASATCVTPGCMVCAGLTGCNPGGMGCTGTCA
jgi:Coenzyme PQQ synthesis protein D (PqqD)